MSNVKVIAFRADGEILQCLEQLSRESGKNHSDLIRYLIAHSTVTAPTFAVPWPPPKKRGRPRKAK